MRGMGKRWFAAVGGLCGAAYLVSNRLLPALPEFLLGLLLGVGIVFMIVGLLPEENWRKLRKWKRRGE